MLGKISCLLLPFVQIRRMQTGCPPEGAAAFQTLNNPVTAGRPCSMYEKKNFLKLCFNSISSSLFPSASSFFWPSPPSKLLPQKQLLCRPHHASPWREEQMKNRRRPSAFIVAAERGHMGSEASRLNTWAGRRRR